MRRAKQSAARADAGEVPKDKKAKAWAREKAKLGTDAPTKEAYMIEYLSQRWKRPVTYSCEHCLTKAYEAERDGVRGYVTDEELIEASGGTLKHM